VAFQKIEINELNNYSEFRFVFALGKSLVSNEKDFCILLFSLLFFAVLSGTAGSPVRTEWANELLLIAGAKVILLRQFHKESAEPDLIGTRWQSGPSNEEINMKALMIGVGLAAIVTPALADYYIIQEPTTKRCRIVEERPAPNAGIIIGGAGFGVRLEAENRMRTVEVCKETTGSGGPVVIEERRERVIRER
jgi:hypothetical protein